MGGVRSLMGRAWEGLGGKIRGWEGRGGEGGRVGR